MIRKTLRTIVKPRFFGKRRYQRFWERLHSWSLEGMNIGQWYGIIGPGELWVLKYASTHICNRREEGSNGNVGSPVVFDVGANIGLYSLEVLRYFGQDVRLYSFEPSRPTYALLSKTMAGSLNAECINLGLSDGDHSVSLYSVAEDPCLASVYNRFRFDDIGSNGAGLQKSEETIRVGTLDSFCAERRIDKIDFLKVDVEGHELEVLLGARGLIQRGAIDFIQFEFGGTDVDARTFLHDFFDLLQPNFSLYRILRDGISPVEPYHEKHEVFLYSNFLAVLRELKLDDMNQSRP